MLKQPVGVAAIITPVSTADFCRSYRGFQLSPRHGAPLASGNIPVKFHFYPCACLFLNWQYFQMFTQGKAHHAGLFRQPSNCIKHLLLLQKQEARCPQVWLFFSLILVELPQCYDYPEGWCSSGSWMYSSSETRRGYTFISISSWRGELFMLSFTLIMDWSCK